jgi:hypothetical protein
MNAVEVGAVCGVSSKSFLGLLPSMFLILKRSCYSTAGFNEECFLMGINSITLQELRWRFILTGFFSLMDERKYQSFPCLIIAFNIRNRSTAVCNSLMAIGWQVIKRHQSQISYQLRSGL